MTEKDDNRTYSLELKNDDVIGRYNKQYTSKRAGEKQDERRNFFLLSRTNA